MKDLRRMVLLLVVMLVPLVVFAGGQPEEQVKAEDGVTTITWGYWGSPAEVRENERVAAAFEAANPDIRIEHMTAPWGEYFTKLQTQFASQTAPDVMFLTFISRYGPMGVLQDMNDMFDKHGFDSSVYTDEMLQAFTVDGTLYGVPRDNDTKVIYYNRGLFDEVGLPYPDPDWTTDEFVSVAQALTGRDSEGSMRYGVAFDPGIWYLWLNMNQAPFFDDPSNPTEVAFTEPESIEALQWAADLINVHEVTPSYDQMSDTTTRLQLFAGGRVAMLIDNHSRVPSLLEDDSLEWDVAHLPVFPGKEKGNVIGGAGYTIYSETDEPDAAWRFWEFLNTDAVAMFMDEGRGTIVPANFDVLTSDEFLKGQNFNQQVFVDETLAGIALPPNNHWWNIYSKANPFLEQAWIGDTSVQEAMEMALPTLNAELDG